MKNLFRRIAALVLTAALLAGSSLSALALDNYPDAYWDLAKEWESVVYSQDLEGILTTADKFYALFKDYPLDADLCKNLQPRYARASWTAEMLGDAKTALLWLEREMELVNWIYENLGDYRDLILNGNARMDYLRAAAEPAIYTLTDTPADYGAGSPTLGTWYGSDVGGGETGESAVLFYVQFMDGYSLDHWLGYYNNTSPKFQAAAQTGGVIEMAWNVSPESTAGMQKVLDASADSYITQSMASLGALNCTVLLRIGAEMNNWPDCDPQTYIAAFRKVADAAHRYGNIKMVFSPDNVSNRNVSFDMFYPGDAYVDWLGVSTYHVSNYKSYPGTGVKGTYGFNDTHYLSDAYYGNGLYDSDPLIIIGPIARFAQEHGKPMMISECGFLETFNGENQRAYAADQAGKLYAYANMIYPNIKAVFYFDVSLANNYLLSANPAVAEAYHSAIAENGGYLREGEQTGKNWVRLDLDGRHYQQGQTVKLATYASFPGEEPTTVRYYVDGVLASTSNKVPYTLELDIAKLSTGEHTIRAEAVSGRFVSRTAEYRIAVSLPGIPFTDVYDPFYLEPIGWAVDNRVIFGTTETLFAPDRTCTNAEILTMIWRAAGYPAPTVTTCKDNDFYRDPVNWAYEKGILTGDPAPFDFCSRAQVVTYLWRAAGSPQVTTSVHFDDVPADAPYATAVAWALENGITNGTEPGKFAPDATCTRAQIATFLFRYFGK